MKLFFRLLGAAMALVMTTNITASSQDRDKEGHRLVKLWETYYKASNADKPKDELAALEAIKTEAAAKGYAWDWYDAGSRTVSVKSSVNWKKRSEAESAFEAEIGEAEPIVRFFHLKGDNAKQMEIISSNREKMLSSHNSEFYSRDWRISSPVFGSMLPGLITNDYDYALWSLGNEYDPAYELLKERTDGKYPEEALVSFRHITGTNDDSTSALKEYAKKWEGKAAALLARQELLSKRFSELRRDEHSSEAGYIALRKDCDKFIADRKAFKGSEKALADCCTRPDDIMEELTGKDITVEVEKGIATITLRNLKSAKLQVKSGKKAVFEKSLTNPKGTFYIPDTLQLDLPALDDGEYTVNVKSGDTETEVEYHKYTLSIALKHDSRDYAVYAADYITGEPVERYKVALFNDSDTSVGSPSEVSGEGFVYLPKEMVQKMDSKKFGSYIQASFTGSDGRLRLSRKQYVSTYYSPRSTENDLSRISATVFTDRTAFNPDETVHFKTILYCGTLSYEVLSGRSIKAELYDAQGKKIDSRNLTTNEFGSASGDFILKRSERGGNYRISIVEGERTLTGTSVRVDDFVLPTFNLTWDSNERMYLPGETMTASGTIKSYSGHSLGSAKVTYRIFKSGEVIASGIPELSSDGHFNIEFKAAEDRWASYRINVNVVDGTGETLEFNTSMSSQDDLGLSASLLNTASGSWTGTGRDGGSILKGNTAQIRISANGEKKHPYLRISYELTRDGKTVTTGLAGSGETLHLDLASEPSGLYRLKVSATAKSEGGKDYEDSSELSFVKAEDSDTSLNIDAEDFFKKIEGGEIAVQVGETSGKAWVVVELYGEGNVLLEHQMVQLSGKKGAEGSLKTVRYPWKPVYGESVTLNLLFFRNGSRHSWSQSFSNDQARYSLPLEFTRFEDRTSPSKAYSFTIKTAAEVECAATVFDASTEKIRSNVWRTFSPSSKPMPSVSYDTTCGTDSSTGGLYGIVGSPRLLMSKASGRVAMASMASVETMNMVEEDAAVMDNAMEVEAMNEDEEGISEEAAVRSDFQNTIAWEPALRSDKDGEISFNFTTSDKLSTYYVQLFAHDKSFNNKTLRREMLVSIPVKTAIVEPQFLFEGDRYVAKATVSNSLSKEVKGKVTVSFLNGEDYKTAATVASQSGEITIPAGGSLEFDAEIVVPQLNTLGILVRFDSEGGVYGSDAVFVDVPVHPAAQTITEAHSALLRAGDDRDSLEASLREMFTNVDGSKAELREISIIDMIREALPEKAVPTSDNVLEQSDALWANCLIRNLSGSAATNEEITSMIKKITACQNSDGGYGWFAGMRSTSVVTAVLLERFAEMGEDCPFAIKEHTAAAVRFLDKAFLAGKAQPYWMGWISLEQYLHVRAMYPEVNLCTEGVSSKQLSEFRKAAKAYLVPKKVRGLNGQVFSKARRLSTLQILGTKEGGSSLAKAFGIRFGISQKLKKSMEADVESLLQYAVEHKSGGYYYPNAVMPWRGLLESELYAHNILARLMTDFGHDEVAEGIRLWMMVQKETQKWSDDHAYIEAIATVLAGREETLQTKVLALSATTELPFDQIKAAGNGFTIKRSYSLVRNVDGKMVEQGISDGEELHAGDKIVARYTIWNEENRSFVRVNAARCAALRPVQQLSGWYDGGYRNVLSDRTEYWFDSYPEENSEIREEFNVTQEGTFQSPVVTIESLYATHYRANDASAQAITVK